MTRTKRNTIHALFRAIHAGRDAAPLSGAWRSNVMDAVLNEGMQDDLLAGLAPRFTVAAAALSVIGLAAGSLTIPTLAFDVGTTYATLFYDLTTSVWALL